MRPKTNRTTIAVGRKSGPGVNAITEQTLGEFTVAVLVVGRACRNGYGGDGVKQDVDVVSRKEGSDSSRM